VLHVASVSYPIIISFQPKFKLEQTIGLPFICPSFINLSTNYLDAVIKYTLFELGTWNLVYEYMAMCTLCTLFSFLSPFICLPLNQGHTWRSNVWICVSCLFYISHILEGFLLNFAQMFSSLSHLCRRHGSAILAQGQGQIWRLSVWVCVSCPLNISVILWRIFMKLYLNVKLTETLCQRHKSNIFIKVKVTQ